MKILAFTFFLMLMITEISSAQTPPLEPGVSQTLARWRAANYSDVRYKLNITLEKGAPLMKGEIEISVKLTEEGAKNDFILDWRTTQFANVVAVNATGAQASRLPTTPIGGVTSSNTEQSDKQTSSSRSALTASGTLALQSNEHLIIPSKYLKTGENVIKINFASPIKTSGAAITRYVDKEDGAEYVYSLFVPSDASTAFPVFDQPDLKARFQLGILAPKDWKVVSNERSFLTVPDTTSLRDEQTGKKIEVPRKEGMTYTSFAETKPISTYVFAFAAGEFAEFEDKQSSIPSKLYVRKSQAAKLGNANSRSADSLVRTVAEQTEKIPTNKNVKANETPVFAPSRDADKAVRAPIEEVFRLNREGVKFLESYFDYKFPFPKYDIVLIPEFPFGGMEHAGATFLREASVIFPSEPTKNDYISRANVIFHEAAHQWFGDTVTMKWFDDLWLKEGFAEFMAYKTLEKVMPEYNAWKAFYERNKPLAYLTDSTRGTTPIYQEIPNLSAAKSAYGNIVYRKAPAFLRQAEFYLSEEKFQTAVRTFLKKHEYANAEWTDLVNEFETASKQDLKDWANGWVTQRGLGKISIIPQIEPVNGGTPTYYRVNEENIPDLKKNNYRKQAVRLLVINDKQEKQTFDVTFEKIKVSRKSEDIGKYYAAYLNSKDTNAPNGFEFLITNQKPIFVFPNYQDYGYGIFLLDEKSREYVLKNIGAEKDDFLRSMMWGTLWDSVREAELDPAAYVELAIKNIAVEQDESTIQAILSRVGTAMNYYTESVPPALAGGSGVTQSSTSRKKNPPANAGGTDLAARLEKVLEERITNAKTQGQRITFYRAYLSLASSATAAKNLKDILAGRSKLAVFQLRTKDKFDIVTRLLILGDKDAPALLENLEKTESGDDAKRYAYAARAGIGTDEAKAKYFRAFLTNKEISESWIEAALGAFNSPRHADLTLPYLETALAELPNLKRTRKIFFVNGWLGAFIGGQKSEEALAIVNKFLAANPNLDKDLRLKVLENVDGLERAVKIRAKFGK